MAVTDTLKDAAYVSIGFGVLGFQKAQVRRQEFTKQLGAQRTSIEAQVAEGRKTVTSLASQLEGYVAPYVAPVRTQIESGLDTVEAVLPAPVQDFVKQARTAILSQEKVVRGHLGLAPA